MRPVRAFVALAAAALVLTAQHLPPADRLDTAEERLEPPADGWNRYFHGGYVWDPEFTTGARHAEESWEKGEAAWMTWGWGAGTGPDENYGLRAITLGCVFSNELRQYTVGNNVRLRELLRTRGLGKNKRRGD